MDNCDLVALEKAIGRRLASVGNDAPLRLCTKLYS